MEPARLSQGSEKSINTVTRSYRKMDFYVSNQQIFNYYKDYVLLCYIHQRLDCVRYEKKDAPSQ